MGTSASKRPSKSLHHGVCIPKPSILPVAMRQQHLYPVYTIYNYAEKHMALSQLFSREKPKSRNKNPMVSNLDFPMKMAVSPSGKSPSFTQVSQVTASEASNSSTMLAITC